MHSLPDLLLIILVKEVLQSTLVGVSDLMRTTVALVLALSLTSWVGVARLVRGLVLQAREEAWVEAARALGVRGPRLLIRHLLPNVAGAIVVTATFRIPAAILAESTVSFIGLGVQPPFSSWGVLAADGFAAMRSFPHLILSSSRATVFLHQEGDEVVAAGDLWLVRIQESRREAHIAEQRQINERGFPVRHVAPSPRLPGAALPLDRSSEVVFLSPASGSGVMAPHLRPIAIVIAAGLALACTTTPTAPVLSAEESFDGLRKIENARAGAAWARPDFDISSYDKVRLEGAGIEFRPVRGGGSRRGSSGRREFPVSEAQEARLLDIVATAFREELARSERFELVDEDGPDVLTLWGGLLDVASFVPPNRAGRGDIFLSTVGEATLVIELRDSLSHATLARILDRRAAGRTGSVAHSSSVSNWAEVRRVARRWATLLRTRLDNAHSWRLDH